jgi:hypothetical protein
MSDDDEETTPSNTYVFAFGNTGFESIVNLSEIDADEIVAKLADKKPVETVASVVSFLTLRAEFNGQRNMEVWLMGVSRDITDDDLDEWATQNPQDLADQIRLRGTNVYGRAKEDAVIK